MRRVIATLVVLGCAGASEIAECRVVADDPARLACYDRIADQQAASLFRSGFGNAPALQLNVAAGDILHLRNGDAALVATLIDPDEGVISNLHIGGPGTKTFAFDAMIAATLELSATGAWEVWLVSAEGAE